MICNRILNQIVASWAVQASLMSVEFVLFASVASSSLNIVIAWTLSQLIALWAFRAARITIALLAAVGREAILISFAFIAAQSSYSRLAEALTRVGVARGIVGANGIALAALATISARNIPESILAFVAVLSNHVRFAVAITRHWIAHRNSVWRLNRSPRVTWAGIAWAMRRGVRIAEMTWKTFVAVVAGSIVNAFEAIAICSITVADSIWIGVSVTVAELTKLNFTRHASGIAVVAVRADFTTWTWK